MSRNWRVSDFYLCEICGERGSWPNTFEFCWHLARHLRADGVKPGELPERVRQLLSEGLEKACYYGGLAAYGLKGEYAISERADARRARSFQRKAQAGFDRWSKAYAGRRLGGFVTSLCAPRAREDL